MSWNLFWKCTGTVLFVLAMVVLIGWEPVNVRWTPPEDSAQLSQWSVTLLGDIGIVIRDAFFRLVRLESLLAGLLLILRYLYIEWQKYRAERQRDEHLQKRIGYRDVMMFAMQAGKFDAIVSAVNARKEAVILALEAEIRTLGSTGEHSAERHSFLTDRAQRARAAMDLLGDIRTEIDQHAKAQEGKKDNGVVMLPIPA